MATIALYAANINQMPSLLTDVKEAVKDFQSQLSAVKSKTLTIYSSICNMDDVISSMQTSTQTQEKKNDSIDTLTQRVEEFIEEVVNTDSRVAETVNKRKEEFYKTVRNGGISDQPDQNEWEGDEL